VYAGVAILLAAFAVVVLRTVRRRRRDEIRSVHHYHDRLDTLHVEPHDRGGSVRVVHEAPVQVAHDPERPRLDPDAANLAPWEPTPAEHERRRRHDRSWALERMQPRTRIDTTTIVVISIVVAVLAAIAFAGYLIQHRHGAPTTTTTTTSRPSAAAASARGTPSATALPLVVWVQVGAGRVATG